MSTTPNTTTVETMKAFAQAWNDHDLEALMSFVTDDCEFHAVGGPDILGRTFKGTAQLREGFALAWQACPDASWSDGDYFASGDRGVAECTFAGTKSDGSRIEARMVDVFTFRDGKIAIKNAFRKDRPTIAAI